MGKFQGVLLVLSLLLATLNGTAATRVTYEFTGAASVYFVELIAEAKGIQDLTVTGFAPGKRVLRASCWVRFLRPLDSEPAMKDAANELNCYFNQGDAPGTPLGTLRIPLGDELLDSFGGRSMQTSFKIKGAFAARLFRLMADHSTLIPRDVGGTGKLMDRMYGRTVLCNTVYCNESYELYQKLQGPGLSDYAPIQFECFRNLKFIREARDSDNEERKPVTLKDFQGLLERDIRRGLIAEEPAACNFVE